MVLRVNDAVQEAIVKAVESLIFFGKCEQMPVNPGTEEGPKEDFAAVTAMVASAAASFSQIEATLSASHLAFQSARSCFFFLRRDFEVSFLASTESIFLAAA
jgi:hypothetical protein